MVSMEPWSFHDGNITSLMESRSLHTSPGINQRLQMHSSLVQRLYREKEMEGHEGCVNAISWNSRGTLLISGSDDAKINIWSYSDRELIHSIDTGHSQNIFCTKFVPETRDELVVSGAGDKEVRLFNISHLRRARSDEVFLEPSAVFQCHTKRVKKLAVEVGNPHVVWSASEDGTLRQHDFRESASCSRAGSLNQECRNILLDLRCGAKRSLASPPKQCLALKSCDISLTRPHQILIGGSDAFARLYDRRMLPPLSSCRTKVKPPPCVSYFCPMHLSERRRSSLHLTHVTFSPNGEEVLLSYSGEHAYLMDVDSGQQSMGYTANDVAEQITSAPRSRESESPLASSASSNCFTEGKNNLKRVGKLNMYKKLVQAAEKILNEGSDLLYGIEVCNEVLDDNGPEIGDALKHECLCIRAALLLKRKWKNDAHMAIRDCNKALRIAPSFKPYYYMAEALLQLGKPKEALEYAVAAQDIAPSNTKAIERVLSIRDHLAAAEAEKNSNENGGARKREVRRGRIRSLSDVLFRSAEVNNEESQYERDDSDYDGEMEFDIETSISGDEDHDTEPSILHGSLNLRFHRTDDSHRDNSSANGSQGSPTSSSSQIEYQPEVAIDMKQRFVGHCNVGTDIKQASFLGQQGEFVASGSDDGRWFIWEKRTGRLVKILAGDAAVVNCVQCHPFDCCVATSGIDNTIKLWTPQAEVPSMVYEDTTDPNTGVISGVSGDKEGLKRGDALKILEANQDSLRRTRGAYLPFQILEPLRIQGLDFADGPHPFECAQS